MHVVVLDCGPYGLVEMHFHRPDTFSSVRFALYPSADLPPLDENTIPALQDYRRPRSPAEFTHHPLFPLRSASAPPAIMATAYPHHTVGPKQGLKIAHAQQRLQQANPVSSSEGKGKHVASVDHTSGPFEDILSHDDARADVDAPGAHDDDEDDESETSEVGQECTQHFPHIAHNPFFC
jgi:hypothetical protein